MHYVFGKKLAPGPPCRSIAFVLPLRPFILSLFLFSLAAFFWRTLISGADKRKGGGERRR